MTSRRTGRPPRRGADTLALNAPPARGRRRRADPAAGAADRGAAVLHAPLVLVTVGAVIVGSVVAIWALSRAPEPPGTPLGNQSVF